MNFSPKGNLDIYEIGDAMCELCENGYRKTCEADPDYCDSVYEMEFNLTGGQTKKEGA